MQPNEAQAKEDFVSPPQVMDEIVRWFTKLQEFKLTNKQMEKVVTKEIIGDKLVFTVYLKLDGVVIAQDSRVDPRSLEVIEQDAVEQKAIIDTKKAEEKVVFDEVLDLIKAVPTKEEAVDEPVKPE